MKLYQVFESGSIHPIHKDKACIVITKTTSASSFNNDSNIDNITNNSNNDYNNNNNNTLLIMNQCQIIQKELSYYNIQQYVLVLHQKWIRQQIEQLIVSNDTYQNDNENTNANTTTNNDYHEIVISYLCYNNCDYFISLVACTTFVFSYTSNSRNTKVIVLPPILLNTRWTCTEIVSILEPQPQSKSIQQHNQRLINKQNKNHYTLLLYDERTKDLANTVQTELTNKIMKSTTNNNNNMNHIINCQKLPNFSTEYMTITTKKTVPRTETTATSSTPSSSSSHSSSNTSTSTTTSNNTSTGTCTTGSSFKDDVPVYNNNITINIPVDSMIDKQQKSTTTTSAVMTFARNELLNTKNSTNYGTTCINSNDTNNTDNTDTNTTPAIIVLTSGTSSSIAKGVLLSHQSILLQSYAKLYSPCNYNSTSTLYGITVPFFHIGGLSSIIAIFLAHGTIILPEIATTNTNTNIGFDTKTLIESISIHQSNIKQQDSTITKELSFTYQPSKSNQQQQQRRQAQAAEKMMLSSSSHMPLISILPTTTTRTKTESSILYVPNTLIVVPAMLHSIQEFLLLEQQQQQFPIVQLILVGGQSLSKNLYNFISYTFPNATIIQTYACTEASSSLTFLPIILPNNINRINTTTTNTNIDTITTNARTVDAVLESQSNQLQQHKISGDCVGTPPSHIDVVLLQYEQRDNKDTIANDNPNRFRSSIDTKDIISTPYTVGIIATRGLHVMNGYWSRSCNGRYSAISSIHQQQPNVWYMTNDLGYWDNSNNNLYFYGRCTDTIRTGGETVQANEVEKAIQQHYMIKECAVFPIKDDASKFGEIVACAIVLVDSNNNIKEPEQVNPFFKQQMKQSMNQSVLQVPVAAVTLSAIKEWCTKKGLAKYKHPKFFFVIKQLPRNSSGKVVKYQLTEMFTQIVKVKQQNQRQLTSKL